MRAYKVYTNVPVVGVPVPMTLTFYAESVEQARVLVIESTPGVTITSIVEAEEGELN